MIKYVWNYGDWSVYLDSEQVGDISQFGKRWMFHLDDEYDLSHRQLLEIEAKCEELSND